jgi:hypothetical protein
MFLSAAKATCEIHLETIASASSLKHMVCCFGLFEDRWIIRECADFNIINSISSSQNDESRIVSYSISNRSKQRGFLRRYCASRSQKELICPVIPVKIWVMRRQTHRDSKVWFRAMVFKLCSPKRIHETYANPDSTPDINQFHDLI